VCLVILAVHLQVAPQIIDDLEVTAVGTLAEYALAVLLPLSVTEVSPYRLDSRREKDLYFFVMISTPVMLLSLYDL